MNAHIHNVLEHDERGSLRLRLVTEPYLPNVSVFPKEIVQIFPCYGIVQVLDEQYPIRSRWEVRLVKKWTIGKSEGYILASQPFG